MIGRKKSFDLLFLDPPYLEQEIVQQLEKIMTGNLLTDKALVICEVSRKIDLPTIIGIAKEFRTEIYGASKIVLYEVIKEGGTEND